MDVEIGPKGPKGSKGFKAACLVLDCSCKAEGPAANCGLKVG